MITRLDKDGCTNLISGIILLAVRDYRNAREKLKATPDDKSTLELEKDTITFFRSRWYQDLKDGLDADLPSDMLTALKETI